MSNRAFLCGWQPRRKGKSLLMTKAEKKVVHNFSRFLQGRGSRCVECLHKATKHWTTCLAKGCDCRFSSSDVYATRGQVKAPGWKED